MEIKEILKHVDHTLLTQTATWEEIRRICDDGIKYQTASVCIPPSYVKKAKEYIREAGSSLAVCTVIGFPNGYSTSAVKVFETQDAIENGADEVDMVINLGWVKDRKYDSILEEIRAVKAVCGRQTLKVIIETCMLEDKEKTKLCEIAAESGAEYIKTSTGFASSGATFADVALMADHLKGGIKIKAAGGISSLDDAEEFLKLGADRLGTSRIVDIAKEEMKQE